MGSKVLTVWDERYCSDAAATTSTTKQIEIVRRAKEEGLIDLWVGSEYNEEQAWESIVRVHDPGYVYAVRLGVPKALAESQGFKWSKRFAASLPRIWAGQIEACRLAFEKGVVFHPVSGAHHAGYREGEGFCTFNFLVGAGREMLVENAKKIGIIDLDAHTGNGTYELAGKDPQFALFDIAEYPWVRVSPTRRVLYRNAVNSTEYMKWLHELPKWLDANKPDLVQYQAGMDCYEKDPVGKIRGMNAKRLALRDAYVIREVMKRKIPMVVNVAGGYLPESTDLHVQTVRILFNALDGKE